MNAYLKCGLLIGQIEIQKEMPEILLPLMEELGFAYHPPNNINANMVKKMVFRHKGRLDQNTAIYEFCRIN